MGTGSNSFGPMNMNSTPWNYGYNQVIPTTAEAGEASEATAETAE
jgi:hypothetical protein